MRCGEEEGGGVGTVTDRNGCSCAVGPVAHAERAVLSERWLGTEKLQLDRVTTLAMWVLSKNECDAARLAFQRPPLDPPS